MCVWAIIQNAICAEHTAVLSWCRRPGYTAPTFSSSLHPKQHHSHDGSRTSPSRSSGASQSRCSPAAHQCVAVHSSTFGAFSNLVIICVRLQFCRYAALTAGIAYGWYRYRELKAIHVEVRDYEHRQQLAEEHKQHKIKGWKARGNAVNYLTRLHLDFVVLTRRTGLYENDLLYKTVRRIGGLPEPVNTTCLQRTWKLWHARSA